MMREQATQCAWCRRFYDGTGFVEVRSSPLDLVINHGICYVCLDVMLRQEVERLTAEGSLILAAEAEQHRRATIIRLSRQRAEALRVRLVAAGKLMPRVTRVGEERPATLSP